jgi:hypothetical protein
MTRRGFDGEEHAWTARAVGRHGDSTCATVWRNDTREDASGGAGVGGWGGATRVVGS